MSKRKLHNPYDDDGRKAEQDAQRRLDWLPPTRRQPSVAARWLIGETGEPPRKSWYRRPASTSSSSSAPRAWRLARSRRARQLSRSSSPAHRRYYSRPPR